MTPERIYEALTTGVMQARRSVDRPSRALAESATASWAQAKPDGVRMPNRCDAASAGRRGTTGGDWNGWGADLANTRFQPARAAGLPAVQVPRLALKWVFAVPGATAVYGQPTVVDGRVFVGADTGYVYALDQRTGCVHWAYQAQAGVRSAVSVGPIAGTRRGAFFGDLRGSICAVDV
jgi:polyvinyl alcohol dehydrogenase (cytochrome)